MKRKIIIIAVLVTGILFYLNGSIYAGEPPVDQILRLAATEHQLQLDRLELGALATRTFPLTGQTLYQAKVVDTATGEVYGVTVAGDGAPVDAAAIQDAEMAAHRAHYGALDPALYE